MRLALFFTAAALLAPALTFAQAPATPSAPAAAPAPARSAEDGGTVTVAARRKIETEQEGAVVRVLKDGRICRKKTETGTRLGGHTDCRTKVEWDIMARDAREDMELHQRRGIRN